MSSTKSLLNIFAFSVFALSLAACDSKKEETAGSTEVNNAITQAYSAVNSQATKAAGLQTQPMIAPLSVIKPMAAPNFGVYWTTTPVFNNPVTNSGSVTAKEYMGIQLDPDAARTDGSAINIFGRLKHSLQVFCAIGVGAGLNGVTVDTAGYPANGTFSMTFSAAVVAQIGTQCGMDVTSETGQTVTVTVTTSSGLYDKSFGIDGMGQVYLVRSTASEINIATGELNDNGTSVSRSQVEWNRSTNVMRVQYVSNPGTSAPGTAGLHGYRLYYDETNDIGQIIAYEGPDNSAPNATRYVLAGKPATGDAFSLSLIHPSVEGGSVVEGCVSGNDGSMITDGSRCVAGATRVAGEDVSNSAALFTAFYGQRAAQTWQTVDGTTALNWTTTTDMLTDNYVP